MRPTAIVAGVVALGLLGWGGFALKHQLTCQGLEEDYVNAASNLRGAGAIRAVAGREGEKAADTLEKMTIQSMQTTLNRIYQDCGQRAGETAARKASDELIGA